MDAQIAVEGDVTGLTTEHVASVIKLRLNTMLEATHIRHQQQQLLITI
jgi:hypothetical protein